MAPITEIVLATRAPGAPLDAIYTLFASTLKPQPGNLAVRASVVAEDPNAFRFFIDWDSLSSHHAFQASAAYAPFLAQLTPHSGGPVKVLHAELTPHPPTVLDNAEGAGKSAVAEVLFAYFDPAADTAAPLAAAQELAAGLRAAGFPGLSGESAFGWTVEADVEYEGQPTRALVSLVGWDSVQAHKDARATEAYGKLIADFRGAVQGLKGFDVTHVSNKIL
ncbi:uncharacterized protein GGS25DRAFT_525925 [Hypoxylon fragiforme]|uniref:uncharacterized protein n=1 Tax=Hypoxylon fragiforme TaxID=63214 RepID=UPI0020C6C5A8|nr:uncharacterized protein GGS25DRAFT_525925 [Hypoxylon fragiforme]KAI2602899.1 hypothetical protein GGS25DRAFT_525925 [Hypoxylon fragiforme]